MANALYMFGDYDFEDVAEHLSWDYNIEAPTYPLGRTDGSRHGGATLVNKTIRLDGYICADTFDDWRDIKDDLMLGLFPTPRIQKLMLSDDRGYMAEVTSFSVPEWIGLPQTPFSVTFLCHDPFEYSVTQQNNVWTNVATSLWTGVDALYRATFLVENPGNTVEPRIIFGNGAITQQIHLQCRWGNFVVSGNFLYDTNSDGCADWWSKTGSGTANLDPTQSMFGDLSQEITNATVQTTSVNQMVPTGQAMQGRQMVASCYLRREGSGNNVYIRVEQYNTAGTLISGHDSTKYSTAVGWTHVSTIFTVSSTCVYLMFKLINEGACKANFDGAMLELGSTPGNWRMGLAKWIWFSESLTANDTYVVDCEGKTVTKNTKGSTIANKLSVISGEFFTYENGYNLVMLQHTTPAVSGAYMQSMFTPRYL